MHQKSQVYKPTEQPPYVKVAHTVNIFLAGTIDNGESENWQEALSSQLLQQDNLSIFNPRRDDWDSSWEAKETNLEFVKQVAWEMTYLEACDIQFFNFLPDSKSPITLLELGSCASNSHVIVCCPSDFYRSGNVKLFCRRNGIKCFESYYDAVAELYREIDELKNKPFNVLFLGPTDNNPFHGSATLQEK